MHYHLQMGYTGGSRCVGFSLEFRIWGLGLAASRSGFRI